MGNSLASSTKSSAFDSLRPSAYTHSRMRLRYDSAMFLSINRIAQYARLDGSETNSSGSRVARRLAEKGMPVVMDFGFWRRSDRERAAEVFAGLPVTWYWVNPPEEEWRRRVEQRNAAVLAGRAPGEYLVDEGLMRKLTERFEAPTYEELPGMIVIS